MGDSALTVFVNNLPPVEAPRKKYLKLVRLASILDHWRSVIKEPTSTSTSIRKRIFSTWKIIFTLSCVLAVSLDPLFFFIPITNEDNKCFMLDKELKTAAIVLRWITDICYIVDIIFQICMRLAAVTSTRTLWSNILINILALLPIPQVIIISFFSKMRISGSYTWTFLNSLVVLQYVPRVLRIYLSLNKLDRRIGVWASVIFSFFQIILASHVLGAFWYFLAIQREIICWKDACRSTNWCEPSAFRCDNRTFTNVTLLNDLCPKNPPNTTLFDFGIYLNALQFGTSSTESTDVVQKILYCFWWGLQHLSSLGQNLQTSIDPSENLFAVLTFFLGILLFLVYVNDIMEIRNQLSMKHTELTKGKHLEVQVWLSKNSLPKNLKRAIMRNIQKLVKEKRAVNLETILSIVPLRVANNIKYHLCFATVNNNVCILREVLGINLDIPELKVICEKLKPMIYTENAYIIQEGKTLDRVLFFMQGTISISKSNTANNIAYKQKITVGKGAGKGDYHIGEEVLRWASEFKFSPPLPTSPETVKSITEVEAFALTANDLKSICYNLWMHFRKKISQPTDDQYNHLRNAAAACIQAAWRRRHKAHQG